MRNFIRISLWLNLVLLSTFCLSQERAPSLFLDCQINCHTIFVKQEIDFVNYVNDRQVADIYVLATSQRAAAGTREIQLSFTGNGQYEGMIDTIVFYWEANVSEAADREILLSKLKEGLLPYMVKAGFAKNIDYSLDIEESKEETVELPDPWKYWSFNVGTDMNYQAEESNNTIDLGGRLSAQRVTEKEKILFFTRYNFNRQIFKIPESEDIVSIMTRYFFFSEYVRSIDDHWSYGLRGSIGSSSFGNTDIEAGISPAIEYNFFPYSDASTRRFSFLYSIGPQYRDYTEETVFNKITETIFRHELRMEFEQTQKWGDISVDWRFRQFLHDLNLYSIQFNPNIELNIVKGLRLDFGGYVEYVGDRINIAKSEISVEDILLQIKQLDTNYSIYTYIGFNYRFGTQRNNIVNPRF